MSLKQYWADVKAGLRPPPAKRVKRPEVRKVTEAKLDGSFGRERDKRLVVTVHPDGRIDLRLERSSHTETIHAIDAYRWAIKARVNRGQLEKARERKEKKAIRLAADRQKRAEKRLVERKVEQ